MSLTDNAFTTLSSAQVFLGLSTASGYDSLLESMIEAVSTAGRAYLGYDPAPSDYVEWHDGDSQDTIILKHWPILQVNALSDDGDSVGAQGTDYHVYPEEGIVALDSGVFSQQRRGVYCYLYAGLSPWPPADLQQAANEWVKAKFNNRGTGTGADREIQSESVGDYSITYASEAQATASRQDDMPKTVQPVLDRYRNLKPGAVK